jgi:hypothetical protein
MNLPEVDSGTLVGDPYQACAELRIADGTIYYLSGGIQFPGFNEGESVSIKYSSIGPKNCPGPTIKPLSVTHN